MTSATDICALWMRLRAVASWKKWRLDADEANELATEQLIVLLDLYSAGQEEAIHRGYACKALANRILTLKRERARRHLVSIDDDGIELADLLSIPASQMICLELSEVMRAIERLPEREGYILCASAIGFSSEETAQKLGMNKRTVDRLLTTAREKVRASASDFKERRQKNTFIGVQKMRHRFCATISIGPERKYLGLFETAQEAALAFDNAARGLGRSKLNFPDLAP